MVLFLQDLHLFEVLALSKLVGFCLFQGIRQFLLIIQKFGYQTGVVSQYLRQLFPLFIQPSLQLLFSKSASNYRIFLIFARLSLRSTFWWRMSLKLRCSAGASIPWMTFSRWLMELLRMFSILESASLNIIWIWCFSCFPFSWKCLRYEDRD